MLAKEDSQGLALYSTLKGEDVLAILEDHIDAMPILEDTWQGL